LPENEGLFLVKTFFPIWETLEELVENGTLGSARSSQMQNPSSEILLLLPVLLLSLVLRILLRLGLLLRAADAPLSNFTRVRVTFT